WRNALGPLEESIHIFQEQCGDVMWELSSARAYYLSALYFLGEVAELGRRLPPLLKDAEERGNRFVLANHGSFTKPLVQLAADEPDSARRDLDTLLAEWSEHAPPARQLYSMTPHYYNLGTRTHIDLYEGQADSAWQRQVREWPHLVRSLALRPQIFRV